MTAHSHNGWRTLVGDGGLVSASPRRPLRTMAMTMTGGFAVLAGIVAFTPWQQTAGAGGKVIAFDPVDRRQRIDAPIKGRVEAWHVVEGQRVKKGAPICQLADLDPLYLDRLKTKLRASEEALTASEDVVTASNDELGAWRSAKPKAVRAAKLEVSMAEQKLRAVQQKLRAAKESQRISRVDARRRRRMQADGLESRRGRELAELAATRAAAKVLEHKAAVAEARARITGKRASALKTDAEFIAKLASARSSVHKAKAIRAKARAEVARYRVALARQQQGVVRAPCDGVVVQLAGNQTGGVVKAGDPLGVIVPSGGRRAVELWVAGRDAPLVTAGRAARVQLEGWPAVQLSGWPALAAGTFEARVTFVAPIAAPDGRFRVLVQPDPLGRPWPKVARLSQGLRARGWIFLDRVSLGYELWRRFNGFPPQLAAGSGKPTASKSGAKGALR